MTSDLITLIANVALTLSFVVALVFGIAQARAAARDRRERFALEALRNFQTREFAEFIHYVSSHESPKTLQEQQTFPHEEQLIFIQLAQQMEALGLAVYSGLISIDLVDRTLGSFVTSAWGKYKTMFLSMRGSDPYIGEYFQWLAERIEEWMKKDPRPPAYENKKLPSTK